MNIKSYYVAVFDYDVDSYVQFSNTMSYENCEKFLDKKREQSREQLSDEDFVILAVIDR